MAHHDGADGLEHGGGHEVLGRDELQALATAGACRLRDAGGPRSRRQALPSPRGASAAAQRRAAHLPLPVLLALDDINLVGATDASGATDVRARRRAAIGAPSRDPRPPAACCTSPATAPRQRRATRQRGEAARRTCGVGSRRAARHACHATLRRRRARTVMLDLAAFRRL